MRNEVVRLRLLKNQQEEARAPAAFGLYIRAER